MTNEHVARVFKTAKFSKDVKKARITDVALCEAIGQVMAGQADDLGAGVFKKRLNQNMHRSIVLAKAYASLNAAQIDQLLADKDLLEICHAL